MTRRVLFIEDDNRYARVGERALADRGWDVKVVRSYDRALAAIAFSTWQVLLLDLGLAEGDGADIVRNLRARGDARPILVLTGDEYREVELLDAGADDYLLKPASLDVVDARLRALARRAVSESGETRTVVEVGMLQVDVVRSSLVFEGSELKLRRGLRKLAVVLAERYPCPSAYDEIRTRVHGGYGNRLLIYREADELRRCLRPYGVDVQAERGFGYRLVLMDIGTPAVG